MHPELIAKLQSALCVQLVPVSQAQEEMVATVALIIHVYCDFSYNDPLMG